MSNIFPSEAHRDELLMRLKLLNVALITVSFSGGGDSGEINDVEVTSADGSRIGLENQPTMSWMVLTSSHNPITRTWDKSLVQKDFALPELLKLIAEDALEESGLDWYNNDGGQGELTIDFRESPPKIELQVGINYTQTNDYKFVFSGMELVADSVEEDDDAPASP